MICIQILDKPAGGICVFEMYLRNRNAWATPSTMSGRRWWLRQWRWLL